MNSLILLPPSVPDTSAGGSPASLGPALWEEQPRHSARVLGCVAGASYLLMVALALTVLHWGLLPGLLAASLGYLLTRKLTASCQPRFKSPAALAATGVILAPLVCLALLAVNAKGLTAGAFNQYPELLRQMAQTVMEFREKLPAGLAEHVPDSLIDLQTWLATYLKSQASHLASMGQGLVASVMFAYIGLVVGALMAVNPESANPKPLAKAMRARANNFIGAFEQIVAAQFWIALFNAGCTAVLLLGVMPLFDVSVPFTWPLIVLTFVAGLVPIVGNLLCNGALALVGASVSPLVGLACLVFLIVIHKFEYVINARVIGQKTNTKAWELLAIMFGAEALFGMGGLVAAPLYYAFLKKELRDADLV